MQNVPEQSGCEASGSNASLHEQAIAENGMEAYAQEDRAAGYASKYQRSLGRRFTNWLEQRALRRALREAEVGPEDVVIDCPCGAGRMIPLILERTRHAFGADASAAMVEVARRAVGADRGSPAVEWAVAPVGRLPYPDQKFDVSICWRLLHHIPEGEDRRQALRSLRRVTRRCLITTYSDAKAIKGRLRTWRGKVGGRQSVIDPQTFAEDARAAGWQIRSSHRLLSVSSLLCIVVLEPLAGFLP